MMTERQRKFRAKYISEVSPLYNGLLHVLVTYGAGIAAIAWAVSQMQDSRWEWLVLIPVFLAGNFFEWGMHKYVMHRLIDVWAIRAIYDRHTRQHHQYFTDHEPTISTTKEFRIVFFPWRLLVVLATMGAVLGYVMSVVWNANAGYVVFITMVGQYLVYETFHFFCHVPESSFVAKMPFINTIRRHHRAHHNMGIMMHFNMNLTFPIADWAMGTSDVRRSLIGTLFNGYSEKHVREDLKPVMERFRTAKVQNERVTLDGPKLTKEEVEVLTHRGPAPGLAAGD